MIPNDLHSVVSMLCLELDVSLPLGFLHARGVECVVALLLFVIVGTHAFACCIKHKKAISKTFIIRATMQGSYGKVNPLSSCNAK